MMALATDLQGYALAISFVAYAGLASALVLAGPARRASLAAPVSFIAAVAASAAWALGSLLAGWDGPWLDSLARLLDVARYALWFIFLLQMLGAPAADGARPPALRTLRITAAVMIAVALGAALVPVIPELAPRTSAFVLHGGQLAASVFGLVLMEQFFRNLPADLRWGAKPLSLALGLVFGFDVYLHSEAMMFGVPDTDALAVRGLVHALAAPLLFMSARRQTRWREGLRLSRTLVFHTAALLLVGVYLLFISGLGYYVRYFGGEWGRALQIALLVAAVVALGALLMSGTMRSKLRVYIAKHFFHYRYDYRQEWLGFTARLSGGGSPKEMGTLVIQGLADLVESPGGALWMRDNLHGDYVQAARWNVPPNPGRVAGGQAWDRYLVDSGWVVDIAECQEHPGRYQGLVLPDPLRAAPARILVPLIVRDELFGVVLLAAPRAELELDWEVTDLLKTAARQAAVFMAQMQATEALLEARKFEAFNRMSAFVVHDLKNIVTQLSLMLKNARRLHANPEFQKDMLLTIESSVEKMQQLITQLRQGQAPASGVPGVDLGPIASRLQQMVRGRGRELRVEVQEQVFTRGDAQRVERVLGHLVHNALDATPASGEVWLNVCRVSGQVQVQVGDTGAGMTQEFINERLFRPFQSTKEHGMGIGAYESFQYIRELGGRIEVDSAPGRGTVVTVRLPLFDPRPETEPIVTGHV